VTWFKVDDGFGDHPKVLGIPRADGRRLLAVGLWTLAGRWCAKNLTDGVVPFYLPEELGAGDEQVKDLIVATLWEETSEGFLFHDYLDYNPSRQEVLAERKANSVRQAITRRSDLRERTQVRDANRCRYCGVEVRWTDRRGALGGTFDLVDPDAGVTFENLVVACRSCNSRKAGRTTKAAGMRLLPAETDPPKSSRRKPQSPRNVPSEYLGTNQVRTENVPSESGTPDPTRPDPLTTPTPTESGASAPVTAQTLLREYIDGCAQYPPKDVRGQLASKIDTLIKEGFHPDAIRTGLEIWSTKGLSPATLSSIVNGVVNSRASTHHPRVAPSTTDSRVANAQALKDEIRPDPTQLAIMTGDSR